MPKGVARDPSTDKRRRPHTRSSVGAGSPQATRINTRGLKDFGALKFKRLTSGNYKVCDSGCRSQMPSTPSSAKGMYAGHKKSATHLMLILDRPTAFLCANCVNSSIAAWESALPQPPT